MNPLDNSYDNSRLRLFDSLPSVSDADVTAGGQLRGRSKVQLHHQLSNSSSSDTLMGFAGHPIASALGGSTDSIPATLLVSVTNPNSALATQYKEDSSTNVSVAQSNSSSSSVSAADNLFDQVSVADLGPLTLRSASDPMLSAHVLQATAAAARIETRSTPLAKVPESGPFQPGGGPRPTTQLTTLGEDLESVLPSFEETYSIKYNQHLASLGLKMDEECFAAGSTATNQQQYHQFHGPQQQQAHHPIHPHHGHHHLPPHLHSQQQQQQHPASHQEPMMPHPHQQQPGAHYHFGGAPADMHHPVLQQQQQHHNHHHHPHSHHHHHATGAAGQFINSSGNYNNYSGQQQQPHFDQQLDMVSF